MVGGAKGGKNRKNPPRRSHNAKGMGRIALRTEPQKTEEKGRMGSPVWREKHGKDYPQASDFTVK